MIMSLKKSVGLILIAVLLFSLILPFTANASSEGKTVDLQDNYLDIFNLQDSQQGTGDVSYVELGGVSAELEDNIEDLIVNPDGSISIKFKDGFKGDQMMARASTDMVITDYVSRATIEKKYNTLNKAIETVEKTPARWATFLATLGIPKLGVPTFLFQETVIGVKNSYKKTLDAMKSKNTSRMKIVSTYKFTGWGTGTGQGGYKTYKLSKQVITIG